MERPSRSVCIAALTVCCIAFLAVAPVATTAQQASPPLQSAGETNGQPASTCFTGEGSEFTIGSDDGAEIWVRLHAGPLTGSGWSLGAEMVGSLEDQSIVEVVAGIEYVGDGFADLLSDPGESFDLVSGFDFQLPMLEDATTGLGNESTAGTGNESTAGDESTSEREEREAADDGRFELLRC